MMGCSLPCFDNMPVPDGVTTPVAEGVKGRAGAGTRGGGRCGRGAAQQGRTEAVGEGMWARVVGGGGRRARKEGRRSGARKR